jgi:GT2 family glycosyltransferase
VKLSISIVTFNSQPDLERLLRSIYSGALPSNFEILVTDNASQDDLPAFLRSKYPEVNLLQNTENRFYTAAENQNLERAQGDYVLSINPDTCVLDGAIQEMISYLEDHPEVGAICPKFLRPDGSLRPAIGPFLTFWWGVFEAAGVNQVWANNRVNTAIMPSAIWYDTDRTQVAEVLYGACIMRRREALRCVGLNDERLVHGFDEYDWCKRARNAGYRLSYLPSAVIMHVEGASRRTLKSESSLKRFHRDAVFYMYRKHFGISAYLPLRCVAVLVRPLVTRYGRRLQSVIERARREFSRIVFRRTSRVRQ